MLVQHQAQVRYGLADLLHDARQQVGTDGGYQGHLELAGKRVLVVAGERDDFVSLVQHVARTNHDLLAHLRELDVLRLALDQLHAEVLLQFLELRGQRRLADEAAFGRAAEMPGVRERHQILQIPEIHRLRSAISIATVYQYGNFNPYQLWTARPSRPDRARRPRRPARGYNGSGNHAVERLHVFSCAAHQNVRRSRDRELGRPETEIPAAAGLPQLGFPEGSGRGGGGADRG